MDNNYVEYREPLPEGNYRLFRRPSHKKLGTFPYTPTRPIDLSTTVEVNDSRINSDHAHIALDLSEAILMQKLKIIIMVLMYISMRKNFWSLGFSKSSICRLIEKYTHQNRKCCNFLKIMLFVTGFDVCYTP